MMLVWLVIGVAAGLACPAPRYRGRHRMSWAQQWEQIHPRLPWQRLRRRLEAGRRARQRPHAHTLRGTRPRPADAGWVWWQQRRNDYAPALKAAGAW
jgi:hypothetical protein